MIRLKFKNLVEDKAISFLKDKDVLNILICNEEIHRYYSIETLSEYLLTDFEFINHNCKKSLEIKTTSENTKFNFINISSENLFVKYISDGLFMIGNDFYPFNIKDSIFKGSGNSCELSMVLEKQTLPLYQSIMYEYKDNKFIKLDRDEKEFYKELKGSIIDQIQDIYTFDSFNEFINLIDIINNKYKDKINIEICNYNNTYNKFNYIEVHYIDNGLINPHLELRLGYKNRNKEEK